MSCTSEELAASELPQSKIYCLTNGQSIGLTLDAEAGIASILASIAVLLLVARNISACFRNPPSENWRLFEKPPDVYLFWLFVADIIAGLGSAFNIPWIVNGKVYTGKMCATQGALRQIGRVAVALIILAMALHTFTVLWWKKSLKGRTIPFCAVSAAFLFGTLSVIIGIARFHSPDHPFEAPAPYWCWISPEYVVERLALHYGVLWLNVVVSSFLYTALFFLGRGNITRNPHSWWRFTVHRWREEARFDTRTLRAMIAYPFVYSVNVIPLSVIRWIGFSAAAEPPPSSAFFTASVLIGLSGVFNVALFFLTRGGVLLFHSRAKSVRLLMPSAARAPSLAESEPGMAQHLPPPSPTAPTSFSPAGLYAEPYQEKDLDRRLSIDIDDTSDLGQSWRYGSRSHALP